MTSLFAFSPALYRVVEAKEVSITSVLVLGPHFEWNLDFHLREWSLRLYEGLCHPYMRIVGLGPHLPITSPGQSFSQSLVGPSSSLGSSLPS